MSPTLRELQLAVTPADLEKVAKRVQKCAGAVLGLTEKATPKIVFDYGVPDKAESIRVVLENTLGMKSAKAVILHPNRVARMTKDRLENPNNSELLGLYEQLGYARFDVLKQEMLSNAETAAIVALVQAHYNDSDGQAASNDAGILECALAIDQLLANG